MITAAVLLSPAVVMDARNKYGHDIVVGPRMLAHGVQIIFMYNRS
jgi:hypothetical protein